MNEEFFSTRRQFRRVLALDWRHYRYDVLWASFYSLAGFFMPSRELIHRPGAAQPLMAPFILLSLAVALVTYRVCAMEGERGPAEFFFNLPRGRMQSWAAHMMLLAGMIVVQETVILIAAKSRLHLPPGMAGYSVKPHLLLLPPLALALLSWALYRPRQIDGYTPAAVALAFAIPGVIIYFDMILSSPSPEQELNLCLFFALLAVTALAHSVFCWRRVQIGELP